MILLKNTIGILVICLLLSCESRLENKKKEGFQIFPEYGIAINVPCKLQFDSTLTPPEDLGEVKSFVCPKIFKDSTRKSFDIYKLIASDNNVYHLQIWEGQPNQHPSESVEDQIEIIQSFQIETIEKIIVDNKIAILYGPIKEYTWEAYIPLTKFTVNVAVSGENGKRILQSILEEMVIEK